MTAKKGNDKSNGEKQIPFWNDSEEKQRQEQGRKANSVLNDSEEGQRQEQGRKADSLRE
jgi:hypothetical protein